MSEPGSVPRAEEPRGLTLYTFKGQVLPEHGDCMHYRSVLASDSPPQIMCPQARLSGGTTSPVTSRCQPQCPSILSPVLSASPYKYF